MKKMGIILMLVIILAMLFVSCVQEEQNSGPVNDQVTLGTIQGHYTLEDERELGKWVLYFDKDVLQKEIRKATEYHLQIGNETYTIGVNPFDQEMYILFLPETLEAQHIEKGIIKTGTPPSASHRTGEGDLEIEAVYIRKAEENGTDLYELRLETYLSMKAAKDPFVYVDEDLNKGLNRPVYVKTNEENVYIMKYYYDARQAATEHTVAGAFGFLKERPNHESLLTFENPNRVDQAGDVQVPDTRDRLRNLGQMGPLSVDSTYTYDIKDDETNLITVEIKPSNASGYENSEYFELQIKNATCCYAYEVSDDLFRGTIEYATTSNIELIKNARVQATSLSTCTDFRVKAGHESYARVITDTATVLNVASGTTVGEVTGWLESTDGSIQQYSVSNTAGSLDPTDLFTSQAATLTVLSRWGEPYRKTFEIRVNATPFVRLQKKTAEGEESSWHNTITAAISQSSGGSTITCWPGEYKEAVTFGAKNLVLRSTEPDNTAIRDRTCINATGTSQAAVTIDGGQSGATVIEGFTLTTQSTNHPGIRVEGDSTQPEIRYNRIRQNGNTNGGGIYLSTVSTYNSGNVVNIHHNTLEDNTATYGGGIYVGDNRTVRIVSNTFEDNTATTAGGALKIGGNAEIVNKNGDAWNAHLLPGTAATSSELERVTEVNAYLGNTINGSSTAPGAIVNYERTAAPESANIVVNAIDDTVRIYGSLTEGEIARLYVHDTDSIEVASAVYHAPVASRPTGVYVEIDHPVEADTDYYVTLQTKRYVQSTKGVCRASAGPDAAELSTPVDGAGDVSPLIKLTWEAANGAVTYTVYLDTDPLAQKLEKSAVTDTEYTTGTLEKGTRYYWRIESVDAYGATATSKVASFTTSTGPFSGGDGTKNNPYGIANVDQLYDVRNYRDNPNYFIQIADIDLTGLNWVPLSRYQHEFMACYDGNGYTISNLTITSPATTEDMSLFGDLGTGATLTNITLENVSVIGNQHVAALVSYCGSGKAACISDCHVQGSVEAAASGQSYVGLLIGRNAGTGATITNCSAMGQVTGDEMVGGFSGQCGGWVYTSYASVTVTGTSYVGGFAGQISGGDVFDCYARGKVTGGSDFGNVSGGFSGGITGPTSKVINCYSTVAVTNQGAPNGFSTIDVNSKISDCFWETTNNITSSGAGTGKTADELKNNSNSFYDNWDFDAIWDTDEAKNDGYPYLRNNYRE